MTDWGQILAVLLVTGGVVVLWQALRRQGLVSEAEAHRLLAAGARVVDVRSPAEFERAHLPDVINVPLDALRTGIAEACPDRAVPVLLHCHSGGRSGIARMMLRRAGYSQAHNLGSYARAQRILSGRT